ncbi:hypothetical protein GGS23DRAFT_305662 [Durotheca rogersii]|uniref:uncharacterized protein n=1 Tax=Durotheca rogersii TaxID=419775 RepID=UPI002220885E|nr:uncharacterized protein GGS23DRAFT_305662 [Durotheca rogersii]KAI5867089.1 hypothetical protein GGS23DRAFT_305662 [Durotheca rogersii]
MSRTISSSLLAPLRNSSHSDYDTRPDWTLVLRGHQQRVRTVLNVWAILNLAITPHSHGKGEVKTCNPLFPPASLLCPILLFINFLWFSSAFPPIRRPNGTTACSQLIDTYPASRLTLVRREYLLRDRCSRERQDGRSREITSHIRLFRYLSTASIRQTERLQVGWFVDEDDSGGGQRQKWGVWLPYYRRCGSVPSDPVAREGRETGGLKIGKVWVRRCGRMGDNPENRRGSGSGSSDCDGGGIRVCHRRHGTAEFKVVDGHPHAVLTITLTRPAGGGTRRRGAGKICVTGAGEGSTGLFLCLYFLSPSDREPPTDEEERWGAGEEEEEEARNRPRR